MHFNPVLLSLVLIPFVNSAFLPQHKSDALQKKAAKVDTVRRHSFATDPLTAYAGAMIKYDIQPTLPGALSYKEIISNKLNFFSKNFC